MKVLVTGDRNWTDRLTIERELLNLPTGSIVVHGACKGADRIAGETARTLKLIERPYPANWSLGKRAGVERNRKMLFEEHVSEPIDLCLAFHDDLERSVGTADMVRRCHDAQIIVMVLSSTERRGGTNGFLADVRRDHYDVYIGRRIPGYVASPFANPFRGGNRLENIERFGDWLSSNSKLLARVQPELRGRILGCWCGGSRVCHGAILAHLANLPLRAP